MRVLCCYTKLHPAAAEALAEYAPDAELVDVSASTFAYWHAIRERWTGEDDLVIVEQDNEIHAGVLPSFAGCAEPWCTFSYPIFRTQVALTIGLGCTKISAAAQRMVSAQEIAEGFALCDACKGQGCWWHLDARIAETLKYRCGLKQHIHGQVAHHHDYSDQEFGEATEIHGRPIEWFFEDEDRTPAVVVGEDWPCRDLIAVNGRQAAVIAQSLAGLASERAGAAVPARQPLAVQAIWAGDDESAQAALGSDWRPWQRYAGSGRQALAMATDLALLAEEHSIAL